MDLHPSESHVWGFSRVVSRALLQYLEVMDDSMPRFTKGVDSVLLSLAEPVRKNISPSSCLFLSTLFNLT